MPGKMYLDLKESLEDAAAYLAGDKTRGRVVLSRHDKRQPLPTRIKLEMSQEEFADAFGIPLSTLRKWEQGQREPDVAAKNYLRIIAAKPALVQRILRESGVTA